MAERPAKDDALIAATVLESDCHETTPLIACPEPSINRISTPDHENQLNCREASVGQVPPWRRKNKADEQHPQPLLIPFLIYCIAMGAVAVPKINVILSLMCLQYGGQMQMGNDHICNTPATHARMGQFMMCANIISGIGCAFSSPRLGALSDRYGRKPFIAFTAIGLLFGDVISIIATWFPQKISVYWILLEFGVGGLTGSFGATMALVQTYASDCTRQDARAFIFARLHACMYLGNAVGPVLGALFIRAVGRGNVLSVFYAASVCHAGFIGFVIFGLKESLPARKRTKPQVTTSKSALQKLRSVLRACNLFRALTILRPASQIARRNLPLLACIDGVAFGTQLGMTSVLILYSEYQFGWQNMEASLFLSITNATRTAVLVFLFPIASRYAIRRLSNQVSVEGQSDLSSSNRSNILFIRIAILFDVTSHLGFAVSGNSILFGLSGIVAAAAAPISPIIQSLMTTYVEPDSYGELLGTMSLIHALARCLIPASVQLIWSQTVAGAANTVWIVLSVLFSMTLLLSWQFRLD